MVSAANLHKNKSFAKKRPVDRLTQPENRMVKHPFVREENLPYFTWDGKCVQPLSVWWPYPMSWAWSFAAHTASSGRHNEGYLGD